VGGSGVEGETEMVEGGWEEEGGWEGVAELEGVDWEEGD